MMTKEKAIEILSKAFDSIFDEIKSEAGAGRVEIEQEILMSQNIKEIRALVDKLDAIDSSLRGLDHLKDDVHETIVNKNGWYNYSLLCELNKAFYWVPEKGEAE